MQVHAARQPTHVLLPESVNVRATDTIGSQTRPAATETSRLTPWLFNAVNRTAPFWQPVSARGTPSRPYSGRSLFAKKRSQVGGDDLRNFPLQEVAASVDLRPAVDT